MCSCATRCLHNMCALHMAKLRYLCLRNLRITRGIIDKVQNLSGKMPVKGERERSFCNVTNRNRKYSTGRSIREPHNKRAIQPPRTENGTGDLPYSLGSNMGLPLRNFILHYSSRMAAAVLNMPSLDINLLPSFTHNFKKSL
jgi:hypothetical protein